MAINSSVSCRSGATRDADLIIFAFAMFLGIHSLLQILGIESTDVAPPAKEEGA